MGKSECAYVSTDDEKPAEQSNRNGPDIKPFEISSGKHTLKKIVDESNLGENPPEVDYVMYLKSLLSDNESSSSLNECGDDSDEKDDLDPQYNVFLANLKEDGLSYGLEIAKNNSTVSVLYEGVNESDDVCSMHSPIELMTDITIRDTEIEENQITNELRIRNNMIEDVKSEGVKDMKSIQKRKKEETVKSPRSVLCKPAEEKDLKSKRANHGQTNTNEPGSKNTSGNSNNVFGDWQQELNGDDVDECYRIFLDSGKIEGDCVVFAVDEEKPVKCEELDVICSNDSQVLMTCNASDFNEGTSLLTAENEQQCLVNYGQLNSEFKKKLMAKLEEPYNEREYERLWRYIHEEKPKVKHYDLRGSRAVKSFVSDELSPSYLATYPLLRRKIDAAGNDRLKKLNYLRGFFFWLQNAPHEDAFEPWLEKPSLKVVNC